MARRPRININNPPEIEPELAQLIDSIADLMLDRKYRAQSAPAAAEICDEQSGDLRQIFERSPD